LIISCIEHRAVSFDCSIDSHPYPMVVISYFVKERNRLNPHRNTQFTEGRFIYKKVVFLPLFTYF